MQQGEHLERQRRRAVEHCVRGLVASLHELLEGDGPRLRCQALCALGSLRHPSSLGPVCQALGAEATRAWARNALVQMGSDAALQGLDPALALDPTGAFTRESLSMLGESEAPGARPRLLTWSRHVHPGVRRAATQGLAGLGRAPEVEDRVLELLHDQDKEVAVAALLALREVGSDRSTVPLLELLRATHNEFVRSTTLLTLGELAPHEANAALKRYLDDPAPRIRASAVEVLAQTIEDHVEDAPLLHQALRDPHNRVRGNALVGLWKIDPGACSRPFHELLTSLQPVWRATAAWVMGQVQAEELFRSLVTSVSTEVDQDALSLGLHSIEEIQSPALAPHLGALLSHPNRSIRLAGVRSFGQVARAGERVLLTRVIHKEEDPEILREMLRALGKLSDGSDFPDLFPFLDRSDPGVVATAIEALGLVEDLAVRPVVEDRLSHPAPEVRLQALRVLVRLGDLEALDRLAENLRAGEPSWLGLGCQAAHQIGLRLQEAVRGTEPLPFLGAALDTVALPARAPEQPLALFQDPPAPGEDRSQPWEVSLARHLARGVVGSDETSHPLERFPARRLEGTGVPPEERASYREHRFLPGLQLALERAREAGAPGGSTRACSLDLARAQLDLLGELLDRAREHSDAGNDSPALRLLGAFFQRLPPTPAMQQELGRLYLELEEYDLAFRHLLPSACAGPTGPEKLLELAGAALRASRPQVARLLLRDLRERLPEDSPHRAPVTRMLGFLEEGPSGEGLPC